MTSDYQPGPYGRLARAVLRHRRETLAILAFLTLLSSFFAIRLRVDSDLLSLMPADDPATQALAALDREEGGINFLTINIEGDSVEARDAFLSDLAERIRALPDVDYVLYKLDPELTTRLGLLQIPTADLVTLRDRLQAAIALGPAAANPFIAARLLDLGPLTARFKNAGSPLNVGGNERMGRMVVRPTGSAHDIPFSRAFMAKVDAALVAADPAAHGVLVRWVGGAYRHNVEDYEGIVNDIGWITSASFVMVLIIIAGAFRTPRSLLIVFVPLVISNLWTLGVAGGTVGTLNTFTSVVNAVLIGLGVDFAVHLLSRYRELRAEGWSVEEAIIRTWDLVGSACASAALTSAAGFASLLAAHFAGFRQLGWLLSLGLMFCLVSVLVCMPLLLVWLDRLHPEGSAHPHRARVRRRRPSSYRLAPMALTVIACVTLVAALVVPRIQFEFDLSELRRSGLAYGDLSESEKTLARDSYAPMVINYPTDAALVEAHERLSKLVASGELPEIAQVLSIRTVLPPDQDQKLVLLREIVELGQGPDSTWLPGQVRENIARIASVPIAPLTASDLPESLQHVLGANKGKHRLLLLPKGNMWDMREAAALGVAMQRVLPGVQVASEYLTLGALYTLLQRDGPIIGLIALSLVLLVTFLDFRSIRETLGALGVLMAGVAWWGAVLVLAGVKLSIVNFVGIPIVLGIGIDVMIHLIHRLRQEGPGRIQKTLATTGLASALATSTTVVAFAALSLASSQGIRSLGLLVLIGEMSVTVAGFILVPLGFATTWRLQGRHPSATEDPHSGV